MGGTVKIKLREHWLWWIVMAHLHLPTPSEIARRFVEHHQQPLRLVVDEDKLDLGILSQQPIPLWQPTTVVQPYEAVSKLYIDIETLGLDPLTDRIIAVGLRDEQGVSYKISDPNEPWLLQQTLAALRKKAPKLLLGYNHVAFDLPFIIERCRQHRIAHPFKVSAKQKRLRAARIHGKPLLFHQIYAAGMDLIDVYHQVLINDFSSRSLTSYSLKQAALQFGLRQHARLELSHLEIKRLWEVGNLTPILDYLAFDLEDTELIANYLVPSIYYQRQFVPGMNIQALAGNGNGTKWQRMMEAQYAGQPLPTADEPAQFEGGLTQGMAGLHRNVSKVDVSSLYPTLMLAYGISSRKDPDLKMLGVLRYLLKERLQLKRLAQTGDLEAQQKQGALKIMINSAFGFLGTGGVGFNDFEAAALITAYGRAIAKRMIYAIEAAGGTVAGVDTDGVMFSAPAGKNDRIFEAVQAALPDGINVEHEFQAEAVFIPASEDGVTGLRKSYLVILAGGEVKPIGRFRSRDRSVLERDYSGEYIKRFLQSPEAADAYHQQVLEQLADGNYPLAQLSITRKIRRGEKALLALGQVGDVVTYYEGPNGCKVSSGAYNLGFYRQLVTQMRCDVLQVADPERLMATQTMQLNLLSDSAIAPLTLN